MSGYMNPYVNFRINDDMHKYPWWGSQNPIGYGDSGDFGDWQNQAGMNMGQAGNALAGGVAAGISQSQPGFMPDKFAGLQGAAQGYAAGGAYGALAGAVVAPATQVLKAHKNLNNLDTSIGSSTVDAYGRPFYQSGEIVNAMNKLPELDKTADWDSTNILGLGRKARKKANKIRSGIQQSQQSFNNADLSYRNRMNQLREYNERMNDTSRLYNLYRY